MTINRSFILSRGRVLLSPRATQPLTFVDVPDERQSLVAKFDGATQSEIVALAIAISRVRNNSWMTGCQFEGCRSGLLIELADFMFACRKIMPTHFSVSGTRLTSHFQYAEQNLATHLGCNQAKIHAWTCRSSSCISTDGKIVTQKRLQNQIHRATLAAPAHVGQHPRPFFKTIL